MFRYGKVFKSHIFGSPTIVSTEAEVNRFILQSDASIFVPSYPKSLTELMGKSSILSINGSLQRRVHAVAEGQEGRRGRADVERAAVAARAAVGSRLGRGAERPGGRRPASGDRPGLFQRRRLRSLALLRFPRRLFRP